MQSPFQVIQNFIERFEPKDEEAHKSLGITETQAQLLWAALSAVPAEDNDELLIPNLNKVAAHIVKFPSPYINEIRKRGIFERGKKRGEWKISKKAVLTMEALLNGEKVRSSSEKPLKERRVSKKQRKNKTKKTAKDQQGIQNRTFLEISTRLKEIDVQMESLRIEKAEIVRDIETMLKNISKIIK